jgi:phosphopantetheinyl transferase (holo-ACP synthase)
MLGRSEMPMLGNNIMPMLGNNIMPMLGNDVIDLTEARALRKEHDERFLNRVFTTAERSCILGAIDPALALWMIWAAKESLFKIESRRDPSAIFAHQKILAPGLTEIALAGLGHLRVEHAGLRFEWEWTEDFLHCVVASAEWRGKVELGTDVRALALRIIGVPSAEIRREPGPVRPLAPIAFVAGRALPGIVSLSHDGRFVAAAVSKIL